MRAARNSPGIEVRKHLSPIYRTECQFYVKGHQHPLRLCVLYRMHDMHKALDVHDGTPCWDEVTLIRMNQAANHL
ncbi:hypothetical protein NDU88_001929 [Pleurodeles waltl]|uniref:Uncharacterized protein n=1 Tax=Pleurodeles waltl TaxID=8319 RepID=A0AAV7MU51_PLEWA|nr:hypothetical protein NDU88_001929 [Pleurodeles waltl]